MLLLQGHTVQVHGDVNDVVLDCTMYVEFSDELPPHDNVTKEEIKGNELLYQSLYKAKETLFSDSK